MKKQSDIMESEYIELPKDSVIQKAYAHTIKVNSFLMQLSDIVSRIADQEPPKSTSYAEALKSQTKQIETIKQSMKKEKDSAIFERDKNVAACTLYIPRLKDICSNVDQDLDTTNQSSVSKPTSEVIKVDLHWYLLCKSSNHPDTSLLKRLPSSPELTFNKVIVRRVEGSDTSALIECPTKEIKNLCQKIIRSRTTSDDSTRTRPARGGRSTQTPPLPQHGPSNKPDDFKKHTRTSDARLRFRPQYSKLNSSATLVNHLLNLLKVNDHVTSYDYTPVWSGNQAVHSVALKMSPGPFGSRVTFDPSQLIGHTPERTLDYITQRLTRLYPALNANIGRWNDLRKELTGTIKKSNDVFTTQQKRSAEKRQKNRQHTADSTVIQDD